MGKPRIRATLYMESKLDRKTFTAVRDPDGYLFAAGSYPTKILPVDLPEWYVSGYMYKMQGHVSAKGVKHLLYVPNYVFDNHLHKYDALFISYDSPIEPIEDERGFKFYKGYDHVLGGYSLVDFVEAVGKYSDYDVHDLQAEIARKTAFFYERNPDQAPRT